MKYVKLYWVAVPEFPLRTLKFSRPREQNFLRVVRKVWDALWQLAARETEIIYECHLWLAAHMWSQHWTMRLALRLATRSQHVHRAHLFIFLLFFF